MGSLKDVEEIKGDSAFRELDDYSAINNLPFVFFSSNVNSCFLAYKSIHEIFKKISGIERQCRASIAFLQTTLSVRAIYKTYWPAGNKTTHLKC